jgi:hypothetical protein
MEDQDGIEPGVTVTVETVASCPLWLKRPIADI